MRLVVLGAYGKSGQAIINAASERGHEVLAVAHRRHDDITLPTKHILIKDLMELTFDDIAGYDAVIDAVSAWTPSTFSVHTDGISHLANLLRTTNTRYLKIGGAGTLYINKIHTKQLKDRENYPAEMLPLADVLCESLNRLRSYSDLAWTYVTPAFNYDPDGVATGKYRIDGEEFLDTSDDDSYISYMDFATALLDIIESKSYIRQRITLVSSR
ncbi:NAD(P)-dependent oxidoreductase [Companilactobacillus nantensis]|uniref:NAD(P)-binding domain-containing protein n=1 Tax=Companilactobacillus nantensis DSM 16982 TaxID=1423774 RepID=A0A0R1WSD0_9LACO|nr:NAD(P)H-binding protein [Companilactobacillus nantensis]KRM18649.1 hypothetical protein FD31_GL000131 [Companilactobacillus nantensis DSM 16982]GEO63162.1 dihydrodipicolinate reductase [Companilactobacillus nantensis]